MEWLIIRIMCSWNMNMGSGGCGNPMLLSFGNACGFSNIGYGTCGGYMPCVLAPMVPCGPSYGNYPFTNDNYVSKSNPKLKLDSAQDETAAMATMQDFFQKADVVSALMQAIDKNYLQVAEKLVKICPDLNIHNGAILKSACKSGLLPMVKMLHEAGADVRIDTFACLSLAAQSGHFPVVKYLIQAGCPADAADNICLHEAIRRVDLDMTQFLHSHLGELPTDLTVVMMTAQHANLALMQYLHQEAGVPVVSHRVFMTVVARGDLSLVEYLVSKGVDVTGDNHAAIRVAGQQDKADIVACLYQAGSVVHERQFSAGSKSEKYVAQQNLLRSGRGLCQMATQTFQGTNLTLPEMETVPEQVYQALVTVTEKNENS